MKTVLKYIRVIALAVFFQNAAAQKDVVQLLNYGLDNAKVLSGEYLMPQNKMLQSVMSAGWFTTAKVHHLGGFDVKAGMNYTYVPASDFLFNVAALVNEGSLQDISMVEGSVVKAPTVSKVFMEGQGRPVLDYNGAVSEMPNGSGFDQLVSPLVGVSVGISLNTEIAFRYMIPVKDSYSGDAKMWGAAFKHSLKNYLPFIRRTPFLQLALAGNYSYYGSTIDVSYKSQTGQSLNVDATGYGGKLLIGMDMPVFGFIAAVGYNYSENVFDLKGTFSDVPGETVLESPGLTEYDEGFMDYGIGMFFRFYHFRLSANFYYGTYPVLNARLAYEFGN